jgi:glycerol-3-phosphate dehydrogenase
MAADYDLIVLGGGINGAGAAQAAAAAGHSVLVLEQYPSLAMGTSGRSSKLIHGGLRYLESAQFSLVRESLRERALLLELAPELVHLRPFYVPVYAFSRRPPWMIWAGLGLYALLGGLHRDNRFQRVHRADWGELDGLSAEDLRAVFRYYDAQTDDAALTRAVMASAQGLGAELRLGARCLGGELAAKGVRVRFAQNDREQEATGLALVNATGPWVNDVLAGFGPPMAPLPVELIQGAHLVLPGRLERGIYYVEAEDGRAIFAMPWRENILVGTTETLWRDEAAASQPLDDEIAYLLASFQRLFPGIRAERDNIVAAFAGLRVLPAAGGRAFSRPREVQLRGDGGRPPRLLSVYGGKLTTYRNTATKVMMALAGALPQREARADTSRLRLEPVD